MTIFSRTRPLHALAALLLGGCASIPNTSRVPYTGDPVFDGKAELSMAAPKDHVLWNCRIAAAALRRDQFHEAKQQLENALPCIAVIRTHSSDSQKACNLGCDKDSRLFIGEAYERVMACYYRGILYWMDGQLNNARDCFRAAQFIDTEQDNYKGDYVLLDYLDGFLTARLADGGSEALERAEKTAKHPLPPYKSAANLIVFAEFGQGPRKYAAGQYGEQLRFMVNDSRLCSARLCVGGQTLALPAYDDLNLQATTRGGHVIDYILGQKAVFKRTTNAEGENTRLGAASIAKADIRCWENLPQRLSFGSLRLAPGTHEAILEFLDRNGQVLAPRTKQLRINVKTEGDTVLFLSEFSR